MTLATIWLTIARKEFGDALRSRMIWGIVVIIAVMTSLSAGISLLIPDVEGGAEMAIGGASQFAGLLVPIMALIAAYLAIAGERESGSLKVILGLPPSRGEVLLGKFLGRSGVVAIGLALGFVVSGLVTVILYGGLPMVAFIGTTVLTVLLGVSFVGIAIGISAVTATRARAMTLAITAYLGLTLLWDLAPNAVHLLITGEMPGGVVPAWFLLLQGFSPTGAYNALVQRLLLGGGTAVEARIGGPAPSYLDPVVFLVILFAWTVGPLFVGYLRFRRADLS
ncbi:ABC transporter permease subunit [Halobellus limi]|uniref:ABC-2 type transport system permease protein n=1 Tax=Halobellus limi TaxID=699433 RepID=A0A1H6CFG6_9EURY|nr:ABC transporter permease subunit [Halobellus limi]QCC49534.1 NosY protein [Halobellus limi]SEG71543.1 ABC-2 type transport system permease protein [Halobellus limi]